MLDGLVSTHPKNIICLHLLGCFSNQLNFFHLLEDAKNISFYLKQLTILKTEGRTSGYSMNLGCIYTSNIKVYFYSEFLKNINLSLCFKFLICDSQVNSHQILTILWNPESFIYNTPTGPIFNHTTLPYYDNETITTVKSCIVHAPDGSRDTLHKYVTVNLLYLILYLQNSNRPYL